MKKILQIPLLLAAMFLTTAPLSAAFYVDGIYYNILSEEEKTVEVTYRYSSYYYGTIIIPETVDLTVDDNDITYSVTSIGNDAFRYCTGLTQITIPESVTSIGYEAFKGCSGLTEITIPESVTSIEDDAFSECSGLTKVNISNLSAWCKINFSNNEANPLYYAHKLYLNGTEISNLVIPNDISEIKKLAFLNCNGLTSVIIGNSVTSIGYSAFSGCSELTEITIPESVTSIGYRAFYECPALTKVNISNLSAWCKINFSNNEANPLYYAHKLYLNGTEISNLVIPNDISEIKKFTFLNCSGLTSATIGNSVTSIEDYAFSGCFRLTEITIPEFVTYIGDGTFYGCNRLKSVIWNIVNCEDFSHDSSPFYNLNSITSFKFGDSVKHIPGNLCSEMSNLSEVTISESVTSIGYSAFYGCTGLTKVTIPNSVTTIGNSAFSGCSGLTEITIPESVTSIGNSAFKGCTKLLYLTTGVGNTIISFTCNNHTSVQCYATCYGKGTYYPTNNEIEISGLKPNKEYTISYGLLINGIEYEISSFKKKTKEPYLRVCYTYDTVVKSVSAEGYISYDGEILGYTLFLSGQKPTEYDNLNEKTFYNLDPSKEISICYCVNTKEGGEYFTYTSFETKSLTWSSGEYQATSTTSARLINETNCDATSGTGFEWRRYDAPGNLKPNVVECPVVDGMIVGSLRGLNPDVYYEFRPYYTSIYGNTYYGEWTALFTGDANVYFEPDVRTFDSPEVNDNSVTLKGYALDGTEEISAQGFEYWIAENGPATYALTERNTVSASGINMSATVSDLKYNTTYRYRAFATTESGTTYGSEMEFSTGNEPSGIEVLESEVSELIVKLGENPVHDKVSVKISGAASDRVQYVITSVSGATVSTGTLAATGNWETIAIDCQPGLYLLTINDSIQTKTLRLIVK